MQPMVTMIIKDSVEQCIKTHNKECTKASCCGLKCGSSYVSWGGSSTGCSSDWRYLYY